MGITNQRETTVVWNRKTGQPIHHAIVWQDRRAEATCAQLRAQGKEALIQAKTGLLIDAYFSGTKLKWLLDNVPGARAQAERGELAFGTIDSWLIWQLTGGARACHRRQQRLAHHAVQCAHQPVGRRTAGAARHSRLAACPRCKPSSAHYGEVRPELLGQPMPIGGVAGDQQSALFGQACFKAGMAKNTYGTGCFMLMHTGAQFQTSQQRPAHHQRRADHGADRIRHGRQRVRRRRRGAVAARRPARHQGQRRGQALAQSVPDSGGVMMVPAFTGLGAPYWKPDARGTITGLTRGTTVAHIARAALESIAYQSAALLLAMSRDAVAAGAAPVAELRVDGGACVNDLLMQFQADLLGIPVVRPAVTETTALGAAYLAGLSSGVYRSTDELSGLWRAERTFLPTLSAERAAGLMAQWEHAVRQTVQA